MRGALLAASIVALLFLIPVMTAAQNPPAPAGPVYVVTHIDFPPPKAAAGEKALLQFAADSRKEPGAVRVEVLQEDGMLNHFIMLETWRDRSAFDTHLGTPVTIQFRTTIQPLLGSPFDVRMAHIDQ